MKQLEQIVFSDVPPFFKSEGFDRRYLTSALVTLAGATVPFLRMKRTPLRQIVCVNFHDLLEDADPLINEGSLLPLQLIVLHAPLFATVCPLLATRLQLFRHWLFPMPSTILASHLDPMTIEDATQRDNLLRFYAYRSQVHRLMHKKRPRFERLLRTVFEHILSPYVVPNQGVETTNLTNLDYTELYLAPRVTEKEMISYPFHEIPAPSTTTAQEFDHLYNGERFGLVHVDTNNSVISHMGLARHILMTGEHPPYLRGVFAPGEAKNAEKLALAIKVWIAAFLRVRGAEISAQVFLRNDSLSKRDFDPELYSVVSRADLYKLANEAVKAPVVITDAMIKKQQPPLQRKHRELEFKGLTTAWLTKRLMILDPQNMVVGVSPRELVIFDTNNRRYHIADGQQTATFLTVDAFMRRYPDKALQALEARAAFPDRATWHRASERKKVKVDVAAKFTLDEDKYILEHFTSKTISNERWRGLTNMYPHHELSRLKRRAKYLNYAIKKRLMTLEQARDLPNLTTRLGRTSYKVWSIIARAIQ